ncbi:glutathione S-transferase [Roseateles sp. DAIF2]|uniref:glutathione S-transferase N-terminal domain-containing protein n=1 Tax=Roseateles sp. DAIF2 TaxID=2714952 RepID=UPI0018C1B9CB|nr:glutathione S-transferase N-terminal domain-containing protein [Roseateles sp. DAIF2]QPF72006.1 glutathione S-transferase [Roseateles sp. DAIF2]
MTALKILGRAGSINVRKVLWTCVELGLDFEREERDWRSPQYLALNPNAMMPVLLDGPDLVLWESNTICRYLAGREGRADLLPAAPRERALVERWMDWQATELNNSWRYAFMGLVRQSPAHQDAAQQRAGVEGWNRHMAILDGQLQATGAFAAGARFTLADVVLGLSTHRWRAAPIERPALPAVEAYYQRLLARPGFITHGANAGP